MKQTIKISIITILVANNFFFLIAANLNLWGIFKDNPKWVVDVDFWGRVTVYSLWFMGYELYKKIFATLETKNN